VFSLFDVDRSVCCDAVTSFDGVGNNLFFFLPRQVLDTLFQDGVDAELVLE
jgi:hypothetical protein